METGFRQFFKRAVQAVFVYSVLSAFTYYIQGNSFDFFFNPGSNNFIIGMYVLVLFCWYGGKELRKIEAYELDEIHTIAFLSLGGVALFARPFMAGLGMDFIPRILLSGLGALLIALAYLGPRMLLFLLRKFIFGLVLGALIFFSIQIYFTWSAFFVPVYMVLVFLFRSMGFEADLLIGDFTATVKLNEHTILGIPQLSGVESLLVYALMLLSFFVWNQTKLDQRRFFAFFFAGLLAAVFLLFVRAFALLNWFGYYNGQVIYHTAQNPLNHVFYAFLAFLWWVIIKRYVFSHKDRHYRSHEIIKKAKSMAFKNI